MIAKTADAIQTSFLSAACGLAIRAREAASGRTQYQLANSSVRSREPMPS